MRIALKATAPGRLAALVPIIALAVMAALLCASPASATVLCETTGPHCTGGTYGKGATVQASLKTGTKWSLNAGFETFQCEEATIEGEVTSAGGQTGAVVSGSVAVLTFGECNGFVGVVKKGTFTIEHTAGSNGTLVLEGFEIWAGASGTLCGYGGSGSTGLSGGSMASIEMSSSISKVMGPEKCANPATMTAEYTVTAPEPLYVAGEVPATVLCEVAESTCPSEAIYGEGQLLALELAEGSLFTFRNSGAFYLACTEVQIEGEIATAAGSGVDVGGPIEKLDFGECSNEVDVLKQGSFSVEYTSGSSGTLRLEGFEVRGTAMGGCKFTGPASFALAGGSMAIAPINSLVANNCSLPLSWTGEFTVTDPEPLYVSEF